MTKTHLIAPLDAEAAHMAEHETFSAGQTNIENEISDPRNLEVAVETLLASERKALRFLKVKEMVLKEAVAISGPSIAALKAATHRTVKNPRQVLSGRSDPS